MSLEKSDKIKLLELLQQKRYIQCEKSLYEFTLDAFEALNPSESLVTNWHIEYISNVLQEEIFRVIRREPKTHDIIINVPPRSLKSFLIGVALPAWAYVQDQSLKFISASYSAELSIEHNMMTRRLIESEWYKKAWGNNVVLASDQNTKGKFELTKSGSRKATSTSGTITGQGADIILIDDPLNVKNAHSETERENAIKFFDHTLSTRLNRPEVGIFIIVMQRLHDNDLTGYLLRKNKERFKHICIPAEFSDNIKPPELKEKYINNLFFPARFTKKHLEDQRLNMGSYSYAGQMQQRPSPAEGGMLKKRWWKFYEVLPPKLDVMIQSWDCAFKDKKVNDYVAGQVWGKKFANFYLIDLVKGHFGFVKTIEAILSFCNKYPQATKKLIEDKANGTAIIETLKKTISGICPVEPHGGKMARAFAVSPLLEAGNVFLPCMSDPTAYNNFETNEMPVVSSQILDFIESCAAFPNADHDDDVDSFSQALNNLKALTNIRNDVSNIKIGRNLLLG